ncbi:MAG: hypothetical protein JO288_05385, partial [Hyphomicrobiales bacterium]|nr:hypothetical protein [Hyphomicrobiales bacterium]
WMRAIVQDVLERRQPQAPAEYIALQISRLNEAMIVAFSAMGGANMKAVDRVVKIVRELDRYHGFAAQQARVDDRRRGEALPPPPRALLASAAIGMEGRLEMAPQAIAKAQFAAGFGALAPWSAGISVSAALAQDESPEADGASGATEPTATVRRRPQTMRRRRKLRRPASSTRPPRRSRSSRRRPSRGGWKWRRKRLKSLDSRLEMAPLRRPRSSGRMNEEGHEGARRAHGKSERALKLRRPF